MKRILICAAAMAAALVVSAPASAKNGMGYGHSYGHGYGYGKTVKVMPMRSNKYGYRRGHARADYVHSMNRKRMYRY